MKHKLSISIDEKTFHEIDAALKSGLFRNKSHVVEYAVRKLIENG
ncbi:MAG: ribbon-helix-helix domain-containing protein [Candidatus Woesearchaeota archaeon]